MDEQNDFLRQFFKYQASHGQEEGLNFLNPENEEKIIPTGNTVNLKEKLEENLAIKEGDVYRLTRKYHVPKANNINLKAMVDSIAEERLQYEKRQREIFHRGYFMRILHDVRYSFEPWIGLLSIIERGLRWDKIASHSERLTRGSQTYLFDQYVPAYEKTSQYLGKIQALQQQEEETWQEIFEEPAEKIFIPQEEETSSFNTQEITKESLLKTEKQVAENHYTIPPETTWKVSDFEHLDTIISEEISPEKQEKGEEKISPTILVPETKWMTPPVAEELTQKKDSEEEPNHDIGQYDTSREIFSTKKAEQKVNAWDAIVKAQEGKNDFIPKTTHNPIIQKLHTPPPLHNVVRPPQPIQQAPLPQNPAFSLEDVQKISNAMWENHISPMGTALGNASKKVGEGMTASVEALKNFSKTLPKKVPRRTQENKDILEHARVHLNTFPKHEIETEESSSFWEFVKIGAVVGMLFLVSMGVLNYSAYLDRTEKYWNAKGFEEKQNALASLVFSEEKNDLFANVESLPIAGDVSVKTEKEKISALNLEVFPPDMRIVIPKIGKNIPIVEIPSDSVEQENWTQLEKDIQGGLREGVVHYPGTALPGQSGNVFITGHSSYYPWDKGRYKDVFAALHDLEVGDEYFIYSKGKKYHYRIIEKKVVKPSDVSVLDQNLSQKTSTLMTCTPIGSAAKRLIIKSEQVGEE